MPATFEPRLDILPESQRRLWPELDAVPADLVLYGGAALALQLGHRVSENSDFFSSVGFDPDSLRSRLPFFRDLDPADLNACDYLDLHTLVSQGVDVATGLAAAKAIDRNFDPGISIRALQFYGDGTLDRVPAGIQRDLTRWAQALELNKLPIMHAKQGLSPGGLER